MSLISTKNFIAPLTNKLHIISIILATTAFVVLRLSGGAIKVEPRASARTAKTAAHTVEEELPGTAAAKQEGSGILDLQPEARESVKARSYGKFQDIVDAPPPWEEKKKLVKQPEPTNKKNSLDDIEKKLGLK
jgi:hypothetical protein